MDKRRLLLTALFSVVLFSLLPLSIWAMNTLGFPWLFLVVVGVIVVGYALLWPYRLVFLGLLILLSATGILYKHGDLLFSLLFFIAPYAAACTAIAYRIAEKLSPVEWVEPEYPDIEPGSYETYKPVEFSLQWNSYVNESFIIIRREHVIRNQDAISPKGSCNGDDIVNLLMNNDPRVKKKLREYMEKQARKHIRSFRKWERTHGVKVERE